MRNDPVVETSQGRVRGECTREGLAFKGIPYGADTSGPMRFLAPQPNKPWGGVLDSTAWGHRAPQRDRAHPKGFDWLFSTHEASEKCLVLNIFTPAADSIKRPVMVWLHGGAFAFGSSDVPVLHGGALSQHGNVVVVSVNHRLNAFGYLAALTPDERFADSGNAGMLDLVLALEWIRDNISAFGGDPDCVTIFGQSGGGAKVAILMAMPQAAGLYHRAIAQSPSSGFRVQKKEQSERFTRALMDHLQLNHGDMSGLQGVATKDLLAAQMKVIEDHGGGDHFRPVVDGRSLVECPFYPQAPQQSADVPLMIGYTATETTFYLAMDLERHTLEMYRVRDRIKRFLNLTSDAAEAILKAYSQNHPEAKPADLLVYVSSDYMYRLSTIEGAEQKAHQARAPVYLYEFAWESAAFDGYLRSPHTGEIPFIFGHVDMAREFIEAGEPEHDLMLEMMDAWVNFARHGNPNGGQVAGWRPFTTNHRETFIFSTPESHLALDPGGRDREIIAQYPRFSAGSALSFRQDN